MRTFIAPPPWVQQTLVLALLLSGLGTKRLCTEHWPLILSTICRICRHAIYVTPGIFINKIMIRSF